jgi:hypothetical protein
VQVSTSSKVGYDSSRRPLEDPPLFPVQRPIPQQPAQIAMTGKVQVSASSKVGYDSSRRLLEDPLLFPVQRPTPQRPTSQRPAQAAMSAKMQVLASLEVRFDSSRRPLEDPSLFLVQRPTPQRLAQAAMTGNSEGSASSSSATFRDPDGMVQATTSSGNWFNLLIPSGPCNFKLVEIDMAKIDSDQALFRRIEEEYKNERNQNASNFVRFLRLERLSCLRLRVPSGAKTVRVSIISVELTYC